jgi:hypothetical protein
MMRSHRIRLLPAVAAFAAAVVLPLAATAGPHVPLKGRDAGSFGPGDHACSPGHDALDIDGAGTASQVGAYTYHADECFNGSALSFTGTFAITAANGDVLRGDYNGFVPPFTGAEAVYIQAMTVTGGTGRFDGADGELHARGLANLVTGAYSQELHGVVSSTGSTR